MAIGLVMVITILGYYVFPPYIFVSPGYSVYVASIVDHKKIGHGLDDGQLITWYTVSVRLFEDDPINRIKSGETLAYIVTKSDWDMVEWGDTVKIRLLQDLKAEMVELFPSLKLPEWREPFLGGLRAELVSDKPTYKIGEHAHFTAMITNAQNDTTLNITLFKAFPFWTFYDGKNILPSLNESETEEILLYPGQKLEFNFFEWEIGDAPLGVYYVRVYLGYFTDNQENAITATTMIRIEA